MLAIDTNVVVRIITNDDAQQAAVARALLESENVFVGMTVLLESAWVLQSSYGFAPQSVVRLLRGFIALPQVSVGDRAALYAAFEWIDKGMGIADAFHVVEARECTAFASFDRSLTRRAARLCDLPMRAL